MAEISLLPETTLTLTANAPLVHVQPCVALLPSVSLTMTPNALRAITASSWPASLPQYFVDDGNYGEVPFNPVLETPTDSGIDKSRKKFTGKFIVYSATVWMEDNTAYNIFMDFYNSEADQGIEYFTIPIPSAAGAKYVRFVPGTLSISSDGGVGWHATFQLKQKPEAI